MSSLLAPPPLTPAERAANTLAHLDPEEREAAIRSMVASHPDGEELLRSWRYWWARPEQLAPGTPGAASDEDEWRWWALVMGRGGGKTRSGAEFVLDRAEAWAERGMFHRVAAVAPTAGDARDTLVEGDSGLLAVCDRRGYPALYEPSKRRVTILPDRRAPATRVTLYSAERPDRLRGPQNHTDWLEEMAAWASIVDAYGNTAWTNADLGLRLPCPKGLRPQGVITTTPKPIPDIRRLIEDGERPGSNVVLSRGALYANLRNLAPSFVQAVLDRYEGTRLGDQEIYGLLLGIREGALWTPDVLDEYRVTPARIGKVLDTIDRVVVGVDPPGSLNAECGIVAVGIDSARSIAYTLEDASLAGPPEVWGPRVVECYHRWSAAKVVGETNYGGDMVRATIHVVDPLVVFDKVIAKVGKALRADPISTLTARGRARHLGSFGALEGQQVSWVPGEDSPDRLDAYVYAATDLLGILTVAPASASSPNREGSARSGRTARWDR